MQPSIASSQIALRMLDPEASLGEKLMLVECLPTAAVELGDFEIITQPSELNSFKK